MFENEDIPSSYIEDYKTLHHDIGLVRRSNGLWDLWFGQDDVSKSYKDNPYLDIVEGDIVSATEIHSLQVGIIISCLTSWNYLNRTGNPLYTEFGNEAYSLIKKNKGINTEYKIKQFFIDCLNRMRRIYSVESLDVYNVTNNPYMYKVVFKVLSVTNTLVDGEFYLDVDPSKNTSVLTVSYNHPYTSASNPLFVECELKNEYGTVIVGEVIYVYVKSSKSSKFKFYGITTATDVNGKTTITIPPYGIDTTTQIMFVFKGNSLNNPCQSKIISVESVAYYIRSKFEDSKHILYVEDSVGNASKKFRLGELLSDYVDLDKISLNDSINLSDIQEQGNLEYDKNEKLKLYLIPTTDYIEGTDKVYYKGYSWNSNGDGLNLTDYIIQLNTNNKYEVHFLIQEDENGLYEIDFDDGHLYYRMNILENEI